MLKVARIGAAAAILSSLLTVVSHGAGVSALASECISGQVCFGRAGYTVEVSGDKMFGLPYTSSGQNLSGFCYQADRSGATCTHTIDNHSWRIRNRLANNRKVCVFNGANFVNSLYIELYSSTVMWNANLPDDVASSYFIVDQLGNCW